MNYIPLNFFLLCPPWVWPQWLKAKCFLTGLQNLLGQSNTTCDLLKNTGKIWDGLTVLHMEDSEKMEDMAAIHPIFKMKKQTCSVWPQKVDIGMIRLGSTYSRTWSRQCCPVVACAILAGDELFITSRVQTKEWHMPVRMISEPHPNPQRRESSLCNLQNALSRKRD